MTTGQGAEGGISGRYGTSRGNWNICVYTVNDIAYKRASNTAQEIET